MRFLDEAKIYLKAGNGGDGAVAFRREKYVEYGGPAGGDGGRGGSITLIATHHLNTLIDFRYKQHFKAMRGTNGMGKDRHGPKGQNMVIYVPVGTEILDEHKDHIIADLTEDGAKVTLAKGGTGGRGNIWFKSPTNRAPRQATKGTLGDEIWVWLRLKLLADCGTVGLPNAGKSSLLSVLSAARPKVADYPFTTLIPSLGVVDYNNGGFVMADIPGLIKGAAQGHGLGHRFLSHIERCRVFIHVIDITALSLIRNYRTVRKELQQYDSSLLARPEIIFLNKCDMLNDKELQRKHNMFVNHLTKDGHVPTIICGSTLHKSGLQLLKHKIGAYVTPIASEDNSGWNPLQ